MKTLSSRLFWTAITAWVFILLVWILIKELSGKGMMGAAMMNNASVALLGTSFIVVFLGGLALYQRKGNYAD